MGKILIISILLECLFSPLCAQQVYFKSYTVQEGLVANPVRCVYQDKEGFIWIGTYEGLSRYDGYKFTNYTTSNGLSHNFINSFFQIGDELLVSENNGSIDVITAEGIQRKFLLSSAANNISSFKNRLLFTTDTSGLYEYNNGKLLHKKKKWNGIALGHVASFNDSLLLIDGVDNSLVFYNEHLEEWHIVKNLGVHFYCVFRDSQNRIWAGSSAGLKLFPSSVNKHEAFGFLPLPKAFNFVPLSTAQITCMVEEPAGGFWIGSNKGLIHVFADGSHQVYNEKDGLPSSSVNSVYFDKENNLWIGTSLGLAKWVSKNNVIFFNAEKDEFKNDVNSITLLPGQKLIVKTEHGLQQFNDRTKAFRDLTTDAFKSCVPVEGTWPLQIICDHSIGVFDEELKLMRQVQKMPTEVTGVYKAIRHSSGIIFIATGSGLFVLNNSVLEKLLPHRITCLIIDQDENLWAGTWMNGFYRIKVQISNSVSYHISDLTSLINYTEIRSLHNDSKKNIWIGTRYHGAFCLSRKADGSFKTQIFDRNSGLMSNWIKCFNEMPDGDIWIGNYLGLDRLVKERNGYRVFNFSKATNFFAQIENIISTGDGNWVCHANTGIAVFRDQELHKNLPLQPLILSASFGVLENKFTLRSPIPDTSLEYSQNAARFEFSALGFLNEKQNLFSYRLKGSNDTTWSRPGNIHEASYVSLAPGKYNFEVRTIGWNGEEGVPVSFPFVIKTPFWKQWWFYALWLSVIALFFYALYRYRIRQLLHVQTVRNRIATDLHDDIGSTLTNINILSELSHQNLNQPDKAQTFLKRISEEVQTSSQAMDDIIWSVNTHNDSLPETMARMRRYAADLFDNSEVNCHLQLDETGQRKLSMEQRRDVYLIYKEALNNISKHAKASNVWIKVFQSQNQLHMHISDDGEGFDMLSDNHRNGLKNLQTRVKKWKGNIAIQSQAGTGTQIDLKIPLKDA